MLTDRIANFLRNRSTRRSSARRIASVSRNRRFVPGTEAAALESRALLTTVSVGQYSTFQYSQDGYLAFYNAGTLTEVNMVNGTTSTFNVGITWKKVLQIGDALVYFNGNGTSITEVNLATSSSNVWNVGGQSTYWQVPLSGQTDGYLAFYNAGTLYDINLDANSQSSFGFGTNWTTSWQPVGSDLVTFYGNGVVTEIFLPSGGSMKTYNVGTGYTNTWQVNEIANYGGLSLNFYGNGVLVQVGLFAQHTYTYNIGSWTSESEHNNTLDFINGGALTYVDLLNHAQYSFNVGSFTNSWQTFNGLAYYDGSTNLTEIDFTTLTAAVYNIGTWTSASQVDETLDFYNGNTINVVNLATYINQSFTVGSYTSSWQLPGSGTGNTGFLAFYGGGNVGVINLAVLAAYNFSVGSWTTDWVASNTYLAFYNSATGNLTEVDPTTASTYGVYVGQAWTFPPDQDFNSLQFISATSTTTVNLALHNSGTFPINGNDFFGWYFQYGNGAYAYESPTAGTTMTVIDQGTQTSKTYTTGTYADVQSYRTATTLTFQDAYGNLTEDDLVNQTTTTYNIGSTANGGVNGKYITWILGNGNIAVLNTSTKHLVTYAGGSWNGFWEIGGNVIFYYNTGLLTYTPMP